MPMLPKSLSIAVLINTRIPFYVPPYQRGYSWGDDEIEDFVKDVTHLVQNRMTNPESTFKHFFGGIVNVQHDCANTTGRRLEIVDGQQRLATFFICLHLLIKAFRNLSAEAENHKSSKIANGAKNWAENIEREYLYYDDVDESGDRNRRCRLILSKTDKEFFDALLRSEEVAPERESHRLLLRAKEIIWDKLYADKLGDDSEFPEKLKRLLKVKDAVLEDCYLIQIVSDNHREAYQLFSVLNDRGKALSDGDLLRAKTLEVLEGNRGLQRKCEKDWDNILASKSEDIDAFLRAYYASKIGERPPKADLYDAYIEKLFDLDRAVTSPAFDGEGLLRMLDEMEEEAAVFSQIKEGEWPFDSDHVSLWERDRLRRLVVVLKHKLAMPILLSAARTQSESFFGALVHNLDLVSFRYINVSKAHPTRLASLYYKCARAMRESRFDEKRFMADLAGLIRKKAGEELFATGIAERVVYSSSTSDKQNIRHFLSTLEDYHATWDAPTKRKPDKVRVLDLNQLDIEHIYPQRPNIKVAALEEVKHSIGNLGIWAPEDNKASGNDEFKDKRNKYQKSSLKLLNELAEYVDWSGKTVKSREKILIKRALKIFTV